MNLGATLKAAEKVFGPALPGRGSEENTLSAVRYVAGRSTKYGGVAGFREDAKFHIHFPTPVDWSLLTTKKGTPDFVSDLKESGPQGQQGRQAQVEAFMATYQAVRAKLLEKQEAAAKKALAAQRKGELAQLRQRLLPYVGENDATLLIGSESLSLPFKITVDKTGKIKITAIL